MKKLFALILVWAMLLSYSAMAEDLGIQLIGGKDVEVEPLSLDDLQLDNTYKIEGYAKITPTVYLNIDYFAQFNKDADYHAVDDIYDRSSNHVYYTVPNGWAYYYKQAAWQDSGKNADFAWFQIDVTNLKKTGVAFMEEATVKVIYDDEYEFAGWIRQINYDYNTVVYRHGYDTDGGPIAVLHPENEEMIDMMYTGTFVFGCTLPNAVFEDKESPLRMVITLGDNELTYHIRKNKN